MFKIHIGDCVKCPRKGTPIVVKAGFCQWCNHEHKQAKKKEAGKSTAKYVYKKPNTGEKDVFYTIWCNSDQRCFVCKKPIIYPIASNFLHVLAKALNKFPLFKLNPKNIVLACHDGETSCHHRFDKMPRSTLTEPMWKPLFELEAELKEEYKHFKIEMKNKNV